MYIKYIIHYIYTDKRNLISNFAALDILIPFYAIIRHAMYISMYTLICFYVYEVAYVFIMNCTYTLAAVLAAKMGASMHKRNSDSNY